MNFFKKPFCIFLIFSLIFGIVLINYKFIKSDRINNSSEIFYKKIISLIKNKNSNYYLYRNQEYFYDLSSFKYNPLLKEFSINVILDIYSYDKNNSIKSPFDENRISYIIFNTKYSKKTRRIKTKYIGFISGFWDMGFNHKTFKQAKLYYITYKIKDLIYYIQDLEYCLNRLSPFGTTYYEKDLYEIQNAKRNGLLTEMNGVFTSINRNVDN